MEGGVSLGGSLFSRIPRPLDLLGSLMARGSLGFPEGPSSKNINRKHLLYIYIYTYICIYSIYCYCCFVYADRKAVLGKTNVGTNKSARLILGACRSDHGEQFGFSLFFIVFHCICCFCLVLNRLEAI